MRIFRRVIMALAVAALTVGVFVYMPIQAVAPILIVLAALVQLEFYQLAKSYEPVTWLGIGAGILWIAAIAFVPVDLFRMAVPCVSAFFMLVLMLEVLFSRRRRNPLGSAGITILGFAYVPFMISFFYRIVQSLGAPYEAREWFAFPSDRVGLYTLLFVLSITKISDMGGFAFGMAFGKHKMCPAVSPNKSWEGLAGSVFSSIVIALLFRWLAIRCGWCEVSGFWRRMNIPLALACGVVAALAGTAGDLVESRFKREVGAKDSSCFMPAGMGGFLDMFDSIVFVPALFYPFLLAAHTMGAG